MEGLKGMVNINLSKKVEFRDLDVVAQSIHSKADIERVQELVATLKNEIVNQITTIKKDV